jgi:ubiquinone/menaquinone biosynthesis C-methylase UbiE
MSEPTIGEWHAQFARQAGWTQVTRSQLYRRANLIRAQQVLDVGCGTGVITEELARRTRGKVTGLDSDPEMIDFARAEGGRALYELGDALCMPYPDGRFDVAACHFVLMWVLDPLQAVREMARVVCAGGSVLICAEPDYGGRLDWPDLPIRQWQIDGLRRQGANPLIGRQIRELLARVGLRADVGILASHWSVTELRDNYPSEWAWLERDLGEDVEPSALARAREQAWTAIEAGTRMVYVPLFYAIGRKV